MIGVNIHFLKEFSSVQVAVNITCILTRDLVVSYEANITSSIERVPEVLPVE